MTDNLIELEGGAIVINWEYSDSYDDCELDNYYYNE